MTCVTWSADGIKTAYSTAYSRLLVVAKSGRIGDIISVDTVCTSLASGASEEGADLSRQQNSLCAWGPTAMLPIFQLLGTDYRSINIVTKLLNAGLNFDGFTKIDFVYDHAVASIKVAKAAKAEGELIITGTKGYIYVPSPWWKTDYFEVRFEDTRQHRKHFIKFDEDGLRYEIAAFLRRINGNETSQHYLSPDESIFIAGIIEKFRNTCN